MVTNSEKSAELAPPELALQAESLRPVVPMQLDPVARFRHNVQDNFGCFPAAGRLLGRRVGLFVPATPVWNQPEDHN